MQSHRIASLDYVKAFSITMIVLCHVKFNMLDKGMIFYHVILPAFSFVAGLLFHSYGSFTTMIRKKADTLLVPFALFLLLTFLTYETVDAIAGTYHTTYADGRFTLPVWYLLCLFGQTIIMHIIDAWSRNIYTATAGAAIATAIGIALDNGNIMLPLHFDCALLWFPYYFAGYVMRNTSLKRECRNHFANIACALALAAAGIAIGLLNGDNRVDFRVNSYSDSLMLHYVEGILLVTALVMLCRSIPFGRGVQYVGKNSLIIHGMHLVYLTFIGEIIGVLHLAGCGMAYDIAFVLVMALCIISIAPMKRYLPHFTGQKPVFGGCQNTALMDEGIAEQG